MKPGPINTGCTHRRRHRHGTVDAYRQDRCRCAPCREAARRSKILYELNPNPLIPSGPTVDIVKRARAAGWPWSTLSTMCGVAPQYLSTLYHYPPARVATSTAEKIARLADLSPRVNVPRRLQSLYAIGWTTERLCDLLGVCEGTLRYWRRGIKHPKNDAALERVRLLTDQAAGKPWTDKPGRRARKFAARQGWASPAAYDNIDDPTCTPQGVADNTLTKRPRVAFRDDVAPRLAVGEALTDIGASYGVDVHQLNSRTRKRVA